MRTSPYRVVQWSTGTMGRSMLRGVLARPEYELAGVYVHDPAKVGLDAGELAGLQVETGIRATGDPGEIMRSEADCVLYAPLAPSLFAGNPHSDLGTICDLLSAGKNLITVTGLLYPHAHGPALVQELETACGRGGTSVHGTGVNPGFMGDVLPLMLTGLVREVSHVYARECSDFAGHPSWRFVHELVGLGKTEDAYLEVLPERRLSMRSLFGESIHLVAAGLGITLDHLDVDVDYVLADEEFEIAAGPIGKGTVAAHRWSFHGLAGGRPVVTIDCVHKSDARRVRQWEDPGFAVRVQGRPSICLEAGEDWVTNGISAAAAHAVNAVPAVCEAAPGIRTFLDLPLITGRGVLR
jgi:hypothetical protein